MCKDSQASYLSGFSVVKEKICFPGCPELGPDTLIDLTKLLLMLFTSFKDLLSFVCKVFSEI